MSPLLLSGGVPALSRRGARGCARAVLRDAARVPSQIGVAVQRVASHRIPLLREAETSRCSNENDCAHFCPDVGRTGNDAAIVCSVRASCWKGYRCRGLGWGWCGRWYPSGAVGALAGKCALSPRHLAMSVGRTGVSKSLGARPGPRRESAHGPSQHCCNEEKRDPRSVVMLPPPSLLLGATMSLSPSVGGPRTARSDKTRGAKGMVGGLFLPEA